MKFKLKETETVLHQNVMRIEDFNPRKAATAFEQLSRYGNNLLLHPWRPDFRYIEFSSGYYVHTIAPHLENSEGILKAMGFVFVDSEDYMMIVGDVDEAVVSDVCHDCLIACHECVVIGEVIEQVRVHEPQYPLSPGDVYDLRRHFDGTVDETARAILWDIQDRHKEGGSSLSHLEPQPPTEKNVRFDNNARPHGTVDTQKPQQKVNKPAVFGNRSGDTESRPWFLSALLNESKCRNKVPESRVEAGIRQSARSVGTALDQPDSTFLTKSQPPHPAQPINNIWPAIPERSSGNLPLTATKLTEEQLAKIVDESSQSCVEVQDPVLVFPDNKFPRTMKPFSHPIMPCRPNTIPQSSSSKITGNLNCLSITKNDKQHPSTSNQSRPVPQAVDPRKTMNASLKDRKTNRSLVFGDFDTDHRPGMPPRVGENSNSFPGPSGDRSFRELGEIGDVYFNQLLKKNSSDDDTFQQ